MPGQRALLLDKREVVAPAIVWETLPIASQLQVTLRFARMLAALV